MIIVENRLYLSKTGPAVSLRTFHVPFDYIFLLKPRNLFRNLLNVISIKINGLQMYIFQLQLFRTMLFIFLLASSSEVGILYADNSAYDRQEAINRAGQQLSRIDQGQKEAARQRYDATHSNTSNSAEGFGPLILIVIIIAICFSYRNSRSKEKAAAAQSFRTAQIEDCRKLEEQERNALLYERLKKATSLGFSVENETKECPACAENIKMKAKVCRYCQKEFSEKEIELAIQVKVDAFLANPSHSVNRNIANATDTITEAKKLINGKLFTEAIDMLTKAIGDNYKLADCHYLRAVSYSKIKNSKEMIVDLQLSASHGNKEAIIALEKIRQNNKNKVQS